jgi:hypothetical protein
MRCLVIALAAAIVGTAQTSVAVAQDVKIETPAPTRPPSITPGRLYERPPSDDSYYPDAPIVPYDPAFVPALTIDIDARSSTGRAGLSAWTAPNAAVRAAKRHSGRHARGPTVSS